MIKVLLYEKNVYIRKHLSIELCNDPEVELVATCDDVKTMLILFDAIDIDVALITTDHPCYNRFTNILAIEYPDIRLVGIPRKDFLVNESCEVNSGSSSFICKYNVQAEEIIEDLKYVHHY